jgi:hypothetical protein
MIKPLDVKLSTWTLSIQLTKKGIQKNYKKCKIKKKNACTNENMLLTFGKKIMIGKN